MERGSITEDTQLDLLMTLLDGFIKGQQEANVHLRDRVAILEQENRIRERKDDLGEVETNTRTIDGLLSRIVHLEGRVLEMERAAAIKEARLIKFKKGLSSSESSFDDSIVLNTNIKKFPTMKSTIIDSTKDITKYLIDSDKQ